MRNALNASRRLHPQDRSRLQRDLDLMVTRPNPYAVLRKAQEDSWWRDLEAATAAQPEQTTSHRSRLAAARPVLADPEGCQDCGGTLWITEAAQPTPHGYAAARVRACEPCRVAVIAQREATASTAGRRGTARRS